MKKYKFRLASVLRVRRIQEDQAKAAALLANQRVALARTVLNARKDHYNSYVAQTAQQAALMSSASDYLAFRAMQKLAAEGIAFAEVNLTVTEEVAEERRTEWVERRQKVQTLERLDERRREEHRVEADREYAKEVDDIVVTQFRRQR